jgi:predicted nucleic acid-binding protein
MDENINPEDVVIDASIAVAEILPDEKIAKEIENYFHLFAKSKLNFVAPLLLKYEVTNAMKSAVLQKRTTIMDSKQMLNKFFSLPIVYLDVDFEIALELALKENISVYDSAYLYLSKMYKLKLLTLDEKLA